MSVFEKLKDKSCNSQNRRSGEMTNSLFETYKNSVMKHGKNIFQIESDIEMATMCEYPPSKYALQHWKCILSCCVQFPQMDTPSTKSDKQNSNVIPTMNVHIYQHISHCNVHGRIPFNEKKQCQWCETYTDSIVTSKLRRQAPGGIQASFRF